jgi:hypothetical protein
MTKSVIVLSVLWFTSSVYLFGISWSLYCLSSDLRVLFTSLVSPGHCIVCPLRTDNTMTRRYQRGKQKSYIRAQTIQWPRDTKEVNKRTDNTMTKRYQRGKQNSRLVFTSLVTLGHCIVCPLFTSSVYLFGVSWSLYCLSSDLRLLFTSLVSPGHCIVYPLIYNFCLPLWYLDRKFNDQEIPKR